MMTQSLSVMFRSKPYGFSVSDDMSVLVEADSQAFAAGVRTGMRVTHVGSNVATMDVLRAASLPVEIRFAAST